jgi:hypothetical protein
MTSDGYLDLTQMYNTDGTLIFEVLNDLMNLYVDDAKDPTTVASNINKKTFNVLSLFVLSGEKKLGEKLLSTPIIKNYITQKVVNEDELANFQFININEKIGEEHNIESLILKYKDKFGTKHKFTKQENEEMLYLWNSLATYGQELTTMLLGSKQDANGFGKNTNNAVYNLENIRFTLKLDTAEFTEFLKDVNSQNFRSDYNNDRQVIHNFAQKFNGTSLGTYLKNSTIAWLNFAGKEYEMYSKSALDIARSVGMDLGYNYLTSKKVNNAIFNNLHAYQNSKSPLGMLSPKLIKEMFVGKKSTAHLFNRLNTRTNIKRPAVFENTAIGKLFIRCEKS